jgi:hypothetical protein
MKELKFEENNLKWAIKTYNYHYEKRTIPNKNSEEYALYKYGEYICRLEKY